MKTYQRVAIGMALGGLVGAGIAVWSLKQPPVYEFIGIRSYDFTIAFQCQALEHPAAILISLGSLIGAMVVGAWAGSKHWGGMVSTGVAGLAAGIALMFYVEIKVTDWISQMSEQNSSMQDAFVHLNCLQAMSRQATNECYRVLFQDRCRMSLTNYMHRMETQPPPYGREPGTNDAMYKVFKNYLATHNLDSPTSSPVIVVAETNRPSGSSALPLIYKSVPVQF